MHQQRAIAFSDEIVRINEQDIPEILDQKTFFSSVSRYSNRQKMGMDLHGIKGEVVLGEMDEHILELLLAGELIHIEKIPALDLESTGLCNPVNK